MNGTVPAAPWSTALKVTSAIATLLILAVSYGAWRAVPQTGAARPFGTVVACLPAAVALGALLWIVTGYEIDADRLRVRRLLWTTTIRFERAVRAWQDPHATRGALRVFGNGGLYSFSGIFWSKRLGRFRLFATDLARCVVLVSPGRIVVVSPADPEQLLEHIRWLFPEVKGRED